MSFTPNIWELLQRLDYCSGSFIHLLTESLIILVLDLEYHNHEYFHTFMAALILGSWIGYVLYVMRRFLGNLWRGRASCFSFDSCWSGWLVLELWPLTRT